MGASKTEVFSEEQNRIAIVTKALGHPARIAIVDLLRRRGIQSGIEITEFIPLSQPTVSQHLRQLRNAGVLNGKFEGALIYYDLNKAVMEEILNYTTNTLASIGRPKANALG